MINQKDATAEAFVYYTRLTKVKKYVDQHLEDKISLATAAQIAGIVNPLMFGLVPDPTHDALARYGQACRGSFTNQ